MQKKFITNLVLMVLFSILSLLLKARNQLIQLFILILQLLNNSLIFSFFIPSLFLELFHFGVEFVDNNVVLLNITQQMFWLSVGFYQLLTQILDFELIFLPESDIFLLKLLVLSKNRMNHAVVCPLCLSQSLQLWLIILMNRTRYLFSSWFQIVVLFI